MRVGIGYDIHRLIATVDQESLRIGGIEVPCFYRLEAHSDGDVLLHALVDGCLGALALGDIGQWFPDTDEKNRNRSSVDFVRLVYEELHRLGWEINQVDSVVFLEKPKVAPYVDAIRRSIAQMLGVELSSISVKAKTAEGLGPVGRRQAIAAQVVLTLKRLTR